MSYEWGTEVDKRDDFKVQIKNRDFNVNFLIYKN